MDPPPTRLPPSTLDERRPKGTPEHAIRLDQL